MKLKLKTINNSKSNLGKSLEDDINMTNNYYVINDIAVIYKKPTPIQVVKVNYPSRNKCRIVEAFYKTPSTTDYNGLYDGMYIDFDAKETHNKTAFPLENIKPHQIKHLEQVFNNKGIAFLIINFCLQNKYYILSYKNLLNFKTIYPTRKSIPYSFFEENCLEIKINYMPRLDYITLIKNNLNYFLKTN